MYDQVTMKLNVDPLILGALKEDITSEDVSTNSVMPHPQAGEVDLICKQDGIICGMQVFERVFTLLDEDTKVEFFVQDGEASLLAGSKTKLLDTRKTTPNNRIFEKYAVRTGGGNNHRYNLSDGVLLKDNHIGAAGGVKQAIAAAKEYAPFVRKIEVEVENQQMVEEAVEAGADIIMLDNMDTDALKKAIAFINGRAEIEVSGNVTKENIARLVDLGVDFISSGALTHSAPIMDISLKNLHPVD